MSRRVTARLRRAVAPRCSVNMTNDPFRFAPRSVAGPRAAVAIRRRRPSGDSVGDKGRVPPDPADEVGAAVVLEALSEDVKPGHRRTAATLLDLAVPIEHRHQQPWVGPAISGGPQHGADPGCTQIELPYAGGSDDGPARLRGEYFGGQPIRRDVVLDAGEELVHPAPGLGNGRGQVGCEIDAMAVDSGQPADQAHAVGLQGGEVE